MICQVSGSNVYNRRLVILKPHHFVILVSNACITSLTGVFTGFKKTKMVCLNHTHPITHTGTTIKITANIQNARLCYKSQILIHTHKKKEKYRNKTTKLARPEYKGCTYSNVRIKKENEVKYKSKDH